MGEHLKFDIGRVSNGPTILKSAFRLLPVYPGDYDLLGFKIEEKIYIDKYMPMGCSAPEVNEMLILGPFFQVLHFFLIFEP
jgi:hypothetical protein